LLTRQFGVECEVIGGSEYAVEQAMTAQGLECHAVGYTHAVLSHWKIVPDGSVDDGFEVVSPILSGDQGKRDLRRAMQALRDAECTTDRSTGLHVHHDITDLTARQIAALAHLWAAEQGLIDQFVARSRRNQSAGYCPPLDDDTLRRIDRFAATHGDTRVTPGNATDLHVGRYRSLNLASYPLYGTVEIRQHQGTVNGTKALAWVELGQAYIERVRRGGAVARPVATVAELLDRCERVGMSSTVAAYLADRAEALAGGRIAA
jgi:hypothetical protein